MQVVCWALKLNVEPRSTKSVQQGLHDDEQSPHLIYKIRSTRYIYSSLGVVVLAMTFVNKFSLLCTMLICSWRM